MTAPDTQKDTSFYYVDLVFFLSPKFPLLSSSYKKQSSATTNVITCLNIVLFVITQEHTDLSVFMLSIAFDIILSDLFFINLGIWNFFTICQAE